MMGRSRQERRAHRFLIGLPNTAPFIGAGVSIVLGVVVTMVADEQALLGLCVGLLGTVIAFQVDALARFERRAEGEDRLAAILKNVEGEPWVLDAFRDIAPAVRAIRGNDLLTRAARENLDETATFFERAGRGVIERGVDFRDLVTLLNGTCASIRANTLSRSERDFWRGRGQEYWDANVGALRRRVTVQRVFVYAEPDEEFDRVSAFQAAIGVEVYRITEDRLPAELVEHILILDESWSQEIRLAADDRAQKYIYRSNPRDVSAAIRSFEQIRQRATRLSREQAVDELKAKGETPPARVVPT